MKSLGTAAMVAAGAVAIAVVVGLSMVDAQRAPSADGNAPQRATKAEPAPAPEAPAQHRAVVFPPNAFPKEWKFYPDKPEVQRLLQRNIGKSVPALYVGTFYGEGGSSDLKSLRGKPVLIDFWGSWCPPCRASVPHINEIYAQHKDELHVIGVHSTKQAARMIGTATQLQMAYPTAADQNNRSSRMLGVQWWPFYVLIDSEGKLRAAGMSSAHVGDAVQRLLDIEAGRWPVKKAAQE